MLFDVIGANLSVASAVNPGITRMFSELVHFDEGSEFYKLSPPVPPVLVGMSFREALVWFSERDIILIGVESDELRDSYQTQNNYGDYLQSTKVGHRGVYVNPKSYIIRDMTLFL